MNLNFFCILVFAWYGKKTQGHNRTENAKYVNSLSFSLFFLFVTQKYVYLVGLVCRFTSSSLKGTRNSSYSTAYIFRTHPFSMAEVMPSLLLYIKKDTPWYFSAICFDFLLPSSSLFLSSGKKLVQLSGSKCVFPSLLLLEWKGKNVWWKTFRKYIAHSSSFLTITFWMRCRGSFFYFQNGKEHNFHTNCMQTLEEKCLYCFWLTRWLVGCGLSGWLAGEAHA